MAGPDFFAVSGFAACCGGDAGGGGGGGAACDAGRADDTDFAGDAGFTGATGLRSPLGVGGVLNFSEMIGRRGGEVIHLSVFAASNAGDIDPS